MPFHLLNYTVDLGTTENTDVPANTSDNIFTISNNHFQPQRNYNLIYAAANSATLNRARIVSPTNRQITLPFIRGIIAAASPGNDPNVADYRANPFTVQGLEELAVEATSDIVMGTERMNAYLALEDNFVPWPAGQLFTMRGTSTTASVANTWTTRTVTWADTLPEGTYLVGGLEVIGATQQAARLILNEQEFRPGSLALTAVSQKSHRLFRKGRLGVWGQFRSTALPQVQVLNTAAVSVHTVYMDIQRIG